MGGAGGGGAAAGGREGEVEAHGNASSRLCVHHIKYLTGMHSLLAADMLY
jgi:glutamate synthase domain-containing protein 3